MKKLIFILMVGSLFAQITPYISTGMNFSLNNEGKGIFDKKSGIRWGYEITGGILAGPLHLKMSYGKKHFRNLTQFINYYTFGGGLAIIGYERGFAKLTDGQNKIIEGKRSNIYRRIDLPYCCCLGYNWNGSSRYFTYQLLFKRKIYFFRYNICKS